MAAKLNSTRQLLAQYASVLTQLRDREVLRSTNNPVADYAEWLVARGLKLKLEANSTAGFDASDPVTGEKYEIKGRRISHRTPASMNPQVSAIRGLDAHRFDYLVGVNFNEDFTLLRAAKIPYEVIKEIAPFVAHTNSYRLRLTQAVWSLPGVEDVASKLRKAQGR